MRFAPFAGRRWDDHHNDIISYNHNHHDFIIFTINSWATVDDHDHDYDYDYDYDCNYDDSRCSNHD